MTCSTTNDLTELVHRAEALLARGGRQILGIVGPPGGGKSTLADTVVAQIEPAACRIPMDGFHLANSQLDRLGMRDRKGAPETFDVDGYVDLLERLRNQPLGKTLYAPEFRRELEEPIAAAIAVPSDARLIVTEGNYLLLDDGPWSQVSPLLDEAWYLEVDDAVRIDQLINRHIAFGKDPFTAERWALGSDQRNADIVEATRGHADLVVAPRPWSAL